MGFNIDEALRYVVDREGSDLHVKVESPPVARVHGDLWALKDSKPLTPTETEKALHTIADEHHLTEFEEHGEVDFSYELPGVSRFRVNAFRQRGAVSIALRAIPFQVRTIDDLGLPEVVRKLADEPRGIILPTGTTGSGKSTTLAASGPGVCIPKPEDCALIALSQGQTEDLAYVDGKSYRVQVTRLERVVTSTPPG